MMPASNLLATLLAVMSVTASVEAHWFERTKDCKEYPRDYFIQVKPCNFNATSKAINASGCEMLLSSSEPSHFLVSCSNEKSDRSLRHCDFDRIVDVSEDTLPKVCNLPKKTFKSNKKGAALFKKYSRSALYPYSWHLRAIGADRAWKKGYDGSGVTVATISNNGQGVYCGHPALANSLDASKAFSFTNKTACAQDNDVFLYAHFSAGAVVGSNANYTGIAPGAKFFPVRMQNTSSDYAYASALLYAASVGADIIIGGNVISDTNVTNTPVIKMFKATFRALERLGSLLVLQATYGPLYINPQTLNGTRDGTMLSYDKLSRSALLVSATLHDREWCPAVKNYSSLYPQLGFVAAELAATCGNASYINQYTKKRPFTGFNPRFPDTPLLFGVDPTVVKPQLCAPAGTIEQRPRRYKSCGDNCTVTPAYNDYTAFVPFPDNTSDDYFPSVGYLYQPAITSGAAALLLQAYPDLKGNPYALRQLLLSSARRSPRATKALCGAGFLNLKNIFN